MRFYASFFVGSNGVVTPKAPPLSRAKKKQIYLRDSGHCQLCGRKVKFGGNTASPFVPWTAGHIDHIFPRARGGQNNDENLRVACISCNTAKGAR